MEIIIIPKGSKVIVTDNNGLKCIVGDELYTVIEEFPKGELLCAFKGGSNTMSIPFSQCNIVIDKDNSAG